ncbi:pterin-4a-carbinolamine dehydratase [Hepatocystis sp. ex Piliocolobus tephrosceles]|nr:pterin-4a-carbinolamine dehydratase [Hepatocystis sp. ex Piliocolobus tephrosceles]
MKVLNKKEISILLPLWEYKIKKECYNYIERKIKFLSFTQAWQFMNNISKQNEIVNHHCKYVNDYNKVKIKMHTHTVKDVTEKDVKLASYIDEALKNYDHEKK